jgi:predicted acylesterase/phospholipase RssA
MVHPLYDSSVSDYEENLSSEKNTDNNTIPKPSKQGCPFNTLVLCAGSTRAFGHVGAMVALEEMGYLSSIKKLVGVSSGGCILALYSIGYTPKELYQQLLDLDFSQLQKIEYKNIFWNFGVDTGDKLCDNLRMLISKKCSPQITLSEIYKMTGKSLHLGVTKVNNLSYEFLNRHTHPNLPLWLALRMTTSIPILFAPVKYLGNTYVDGACINSFPISYFESDTTLALSFVVQNDCGNKKTVEDRLMNMIDIFNNIKSRIFKSKSKVVEIYIPIPMISILNFTISTEHKQQLHDAGYATIMKHLTHTS